MYLPCLPIARNGPIHFTQKHILLIERQGFLALSPLCRQMISVTKGRVGAAVFLDQQNCSKCALHYTLVRPMSWNLGPNEVFPLETWKV